VGLAHVPCPSTDEPTVPEPKVVEGEGGRDPSLETVENI